MAVKTFLLTILVIACSVNSIRYDNYKLYKVIPKDVNEVNVLEYIRDNGIAMFWIDYIDVNIDVRLMVAPEQNEEFLDLLTKEGVQFTLAFEDLQKVIDEQNSPQTRSGHDFHGLSWDVYHNLSNINAWITRLSEAYSGIVTPVVMEGSTVEGREIRGLKINFNPDRPKDIAVIQGALHAREWITPATVTWIVKEFLTSTDPDVRAMAEDLEWHIFPVVNPDGYLYTFSNDRMWRKNRSTASFKSCSGNTADDISNGVDLNRNFDFVWMSAGASNDSCTQSYGGPSPASEPETKAIASYMLELDRQGNIIYFLDFHSYSQLIVIPYSHVRGQDVLLADNYGDMYEIAARGADKLTQRHGTAYRVGVAADVLYVMSGTTFDWVKNNTNTKISFLLELRDLGHYGFLLPPSEIIPNCQETMDALVEMDKTTRILGYYRGYSELALLSPYLLLLGVILNLLSL